MYVNVYKCYVLLYMYTMFMLPKYLKGYIDRNWDSYV